MPPTNAAESSAFPFSVPPGGPGVAEPAAFDTLFRTYYAPLAAFAYRYVRSAEAAQDIVQDVFLRLWTIRDEWNVLEQGTPAYLYRAVRNRALDIQKRARVADAWASEAAGDDRSASNDGEADLDACDLGAALARAVAQLSPRGREIFELSRVAGLTYNEIANVLGIAPNTVYAQMGRVLKALHDALRDWER